MHPETSPDLLVIGSGNAARIAATTCCEAGWSVTLAERGPVGGTRALRGCDAKKVLVSGAAHADALRRGAGANAVPSRPSGAPFPGPQAPHKAFAAGRLLQWPSLMRFKHGIIAPRPDAIEASLRQSGVDLLRGVARFLDPDTVMVGGTRLRPAHVLIATGAQPRPLGIVGEHLLMDSAEFLRLDRLPDRLVFLGGGFVSFELAHVVARAGVRVTILERTPRVLTGFDAAFVDRLVAATTALGVQVRTGIDLQQIQRRDQATRLILHAPLADGTPAVEQMEAGLVVHGAGRVPDLEDLHLDAGGVAVSENGVQVDAYLHNPTNARVYAAGDAADTGRPKLSPVASREGRIVARNLIRGNHWVPDPGPVPSVLFTIPALARVGLDEEQARADGLAVEVLEADRSTSLEAVIEGEPYTAAKLLVEAGSRRLLGAHLLSHAAPEVINLLALAIRSGLSAGELAQLSWAYPTSGAEVLSLL